MIPPIVFGIIGSIFLLAAWLYETIEAVREHKSLIDLKFAFIYITANFFLLSYSILINDMIFITLQVVLICLVSSEIIYSVHIKKVHRAGKLRD